jgi:NodT family efflux transporter outer membrane factor (OMF) lipoprotein
MNNFSSLSCRLIPRLALALPLAWSGCNLAPHYARPAIDVPAQFREASSATTDSGVAWSTAHPGDAAARGRWWEIYGDPQLNNLEEQVQVSNQTILAAEANYRAARAAVTGARSALFPTISASPSYTRSRASQSVRATNGVFLNAGTPAITDVYSLPFVASYEIDFWGRVRNNVIASKANAQASAADLATALLSTQAELAQDYFQLRALDSEKQILDDTVGSYRQSMDETSSLYRFGIDSQEDVVRAETQLTTAIAQSTDLGVARAAYEHAIAVLTGKAPSSLVVAVAPLTAHPPAVPIGLPSTLLERRPDVAAAERRAASANAQIGIARAAYFPNLSLGVSGGWQSSDVSQWFNWPSRFWSVGPELAETLFDGGARRAQTDEARAVFDQASANYRQTVLSAFQSVEDNLAALRILEQESHEQRAAVDASNHLLELANTRFKTGIDSYLNVITAQTTLLSNREAEVQIQLRQITASISLIKALGGGWSASYLAADGPP